MYFVEMLVSNKLRFGDPISTSSGPSKEAAGNSAHPNCHKMEHATKMPFVIERLGNVVMMNSPQVSCMSLVIVTII